MSVLDDLILSRIRSHGPITVAEFMELALYHPEHGYYAGAVRRTGRNGDFFTSVDVGPLFGEMIAVQLAEMWDVLRNQGADHFDLIESGAADGRLARDILDVTRADHPELYEHLRVTLVERSAAARRGHLETLEPHADRTNPTLEGLPRGVTGVILANELLDALPAHRVTMTVEGLRETYLTECGGALTAVDGPVSSPAIADELARAGTPLEPGTRAEVGMAAAQWTRDAAAALDRGFLLLFDYGHHASRLWSPALADGTLMAYSRHTAGAVEWFARAGECDLTAHVNLTTIHSAAAASGLTPLGTVDQTYFLLALGLAARLDDGSEMSAVQRRLAARTLMMPGGLGSTMKVMAFGRNVGRPVLRGLATGRLT